MKNYIKESIENVDGVSDVVLVSQEVNDETKNNITKILFKYKSLMIQANSVESDIVGILGFKINFDYTLHKKLSRSETLELLNDFNKYVPGAKAVLKSIGGKKISINFNIETFYQGLEHRDGIIQGTLPMFAVAPVMFSRDLDNKGYKHNQIIEE